MKLPLFQNPQMLLLLVVVASVALAGMMGARWRERTLQTLGRSSDARALRRWGVVVALVLVVLALARPGWRPRTEPFASTGRDIVFVLDVSRSMLARDRAPNRLASARLAIMDLAGHLRPGDRVGLVIFAGSARIVSPLTNDRSFFDKALQEAGPESVAFGGTRVGDALRKTADKLLGASDRRGFQDVILLTDGGDQESEIEKAVEVLNRIQASLLVIGLGSEAEGARIPEGDGFMLYRGREVWTQQDAATLEKISRHAMTGLYLNAGTRALDLPDVYRRFTEQVSGIRTGGRPVDRREEEFPWFLGAALLLLLGAGSVLGRGRTAAAAAIGLALALAATPARASDPAPAANALAKGEFDVAARQFLAAARTAPDARSEARLLYNAATCWLNAAGQAGETAARLDRPVKEMDGAEPDGLDIPRIDPAPMLEESVRLYELALQDGADFPEAARNLEIARSRWQQAVAAQEKETAAEQPPEGPPGENADEPGEDDAEDNDAPPPIDADDTPAEALTDLLNQDLPPPNLSPQDILRQELENNQVRSAPGVAKGKSVEKNW